MQNVLNIEWNDFSESIPAFLMVIGMPLTYSIADGIAIGFICYPTIKFLSGKGKEAGWLMYVLAVLLIIYFVVFRAGMEA